MGITFLVVDQFNYDKVQSARLQIWFVSEVDDMELFFKEKKNNFNSCLNL